MDAVFEDRERERRIAALAAHLPPRWAGWFARLRRPEERKLRLLAGVGLCLGSLLFVLPLFGLWMLPLGLLLLSDDVGALRRGSGRLLARLEARWPRWFAPRLECRDPHAGTRA